MRCSVYKRGGNENGPLPSWRLRTSAQGRTWDAAVGISAEPLVPKITSNYRAAPADCLRLSISTPRQKASCRAQFNKDDPKDPARSDMLGVVEAAYHMVKCSRRALRVCNTDAKIGEFHIDGNFS